MRSKSTLAERISHIMKKVDKMLLAKVKVPSLLNSNQLSSGWLLIWNFD